MARDLLINHFPAIATRFFFAEKAKKRAQTNVISGLISSVLGVFKYNKNHKLYNIPP